MKIWLVGISDCELTDIRYACLSKTTALKRWEELRLELIDYCKEQIEHFKINHPSSLDDMYERMITNLAETDPLKLDNYPQNEPFIREMKCEA